jgi:hypothetical protein
MNTGKLFSPKEIGRSFAELFWRSGQWLLWLLTAVVAGAVGIGERFGVKNISNHAWFRIAVLGAIVSLAVAYHRTRLEREAARTHEVPPDHLQELQHRLSVLLHNVEIGGGCDYGDIAYSVTNQATFKAHYPDLEAQLDEWDAAVYRVVATKRAITTALEEMAETTDEAASWFGINREECDVDRLRTLIQEAVERRSSEGTLDGPVSLNWTETPPFPPLVSIEGPDHDAFWKLDLGGHHIAVVLDLPVEDRAERIADTKRRVEALWSAAMGLEEAKELRPARTRLTGLQQDLQSALVDWQKVTNVRVTSRCPICRKNEGWPEPKPPLWRRLRTRAQHA